METQQNTSGIFPHFLTKPLQNKARSEEEGRPIFEDREYVEIHIAGDSKSKVSHRVTDDHRKRWPKEYEAFKSGLETPLEGTPIEEWAAISRSQAAELKAIHIYTVEALAELKDAAISRLGMGGRDLVKKAQAYIEHAKDQSVTERYAAENARLQDRIEMLETQLKELNDKIETQKRPGRKPKAETAE